MMVLASLKKKTYLALVLPNPQLGSGGTLEVGILSIWSAKFSLLCCYYIIRARRRRTKVGSESGRCKKTT